MHQLSGLSARRIGNRSPTSSPRNTYKTKDGRFVALAGATQTTAARLFTVMGVPEMIEDPRFSSNMTRLRNVEEVDRLVGEWIATLDLDAVVAILRENDVPVGPVYNIKDIVADPHAIAREMIVGVDDADGRRLVMEGVFPKMSATPGQVRHPGREMGADNDEVFLDRLGSDQRRAFGAHRCRHRLSPPSVYPSGAKLKYPLISLFTPGNRPDLIRKASKYGPDAIVIDLEDAVPISLKAKARDDVRELLPALDITAVVRVNSEAEHLEADLRAVVSKHIHGVILAMADRVDLVERADQLITMLERERGLEPQSVKLFLSIETALGVMRCFELATAAKRIETVVFGSAEDGDLQRNLQCDWSATGTEMLYARSKVLLEARAAQLPFVLDGAFSRIDDEAALRADCTLSKRLGYNGRTVIHPRQVAIAREIYAPKAEEIAYYTRLISAFEAAEAQGIAAISLEGRLVDYAMYKKAQAFLGA